MTPAHRFACMGKRISVDPAAIVPRDRPDAVPPVTSMALDVTGRCNLRCVYCAEAATMPPRSPMAPEMAEKALDLLFGQAPAGAGLSLHFGSGEPLLAPGLVLGIGRRARQRARAENRPVALFLTTNGTRLDAALARSLAEGGWSVKVSIDGGRDPHDRQRLRPDGSGTYGDVEGPVRLLAASLGERFSTTSVLCRGTDPLRVFEDIAALGVRRIELVPAAVPGSSPLALEARDARAYLRFVREYARRLADGADPPVLIKFQKRLRQVLGYGNASIPCGAARSFIAAGPDGSLYPCFRFIGLDAYKIGDLAAGIDREAQKAFMGGAGRPYHDRDCRECWAASACGGPCFACAELIGGGQPSAAHCAMVRADGEAAAWLAAALRDDDPERLLRLAGIGVSLG